MSEDRCTVAGSYVLAYASGAAAVSEIGKFFLPIPGITNVMLSAAKHLRRYEESFAAPAVRGILFRFPTSCSIADL